MECWWYLQCCIMLFAEVYRFIPVQSRYLQCFIWIQIVTQLVYMFVHSNPNSLIVTNSFQFYIHKMGSSSHFTGFQLFQHVSTIPKCKVGVSTIVMGLPPNGWFLFGKIPSINGWWLGIPLFQETIPSDAGFLPLRMHAELQRGAALEALATTGNPEPARFFLYQ